MSESSGPQGKTPKPVPVHYFPKRPQPARTRSTTEITQLGSAAGSERELTPTEPMTWVDAAEEPKPGARRHGKTKGRAGPRRSLTPMEVDTDPALRYHLAKLEQLLKGARGKSRGRVSAVRLGEMAAFGHQLFGQGRLEEARIVFEGIVGFGVADAFPHTMLGTIYLALGNLERAQALFEAALRLDPADLAALVYRGEIRLNLGKPKRALEDLRKAVELGEADDPFVARAQRLVQMARASR